VVTVEPDPLARTGENYWAGSAGLVGVILGAVLIVGASSWVFAAMGVATIVGAVTFAMAHWSAFVRVGPESIQVRWFPPTRTVRLDEVVDVTTEDVGVALRCPALVQSSGARVRVMALASYPGSAERRRTVLLTAIERARSQAGSS
jgi:hypothetical protein